MILSTLLETGLDPQRLEVEITEGVLFEDFERALSILRRIKNLGVRIAMDDFGTGYSSLNYLQAFPFDKIKIDQTFIAKDRQQFSGRSDHPRHSGARPRPRITRHRRGRGDRGATGAACERGI